MKKYAKLMEKITSWSQVHVSVSKPHRMCIEFTMPAKTVDPNVYTLWLQESGGKEGEKREEEEEEEEERKGEEQAQSRSGSEEDERNHTLARQGRKEHMHT
jgi:hypothetical protein